MNVQRTICVPDAHSAAAASIADALGYPERGMFRARIAATYDDDGSQITPGIGAISTGILDSESPILAAAQTLLDALDDRNPGHGVSLADCQTFVLNRDLVDDDPRERMAALEAEAGAPVAAEEWAQGTYTKDAVASHDGDLWRSLVDANVWEPGIAAWRKLWTTEAATPPTWVKPSGSTDYYTMGELVTHDGRVWRSDRAVNVWEPGTPDSGWSLSEESSGNIWEAGIAVTAGEEYWYPDEQGTLYRVIQSHTTQTGWEPPNVPALWGVV